MESLMGALLPVIEDRAAQAALRIYALYCCRILDSDTVRHDLRELDADHADFLEGLKFELDYSVLLNRYWRALHTLSPYKRVTKRRMELTAQAFQLDSHELIAMVGALRRGELALVGRVKTFLRDPYTRSETEHILEAVGRLVVNLVGRKLRFVADNDGSRDRTDMEAELRAHALKLILRYEIEATSYDHMTRLVARGLQNHATNLALRSNRESRRVLQRIQKRPSTRIAWWFDPEKMTIRKVVIPLKGARQVSDGELQCEVRVVNGTKKPKTVFVAVERLYASQKEATIARKRERLAQPSKRTCLLDLSHQSMDDFATTTVRADKEGESGTTMWDTLPSSCPHPEQCADDFVARLNSSLRSTRTREFVDIILGQNDFFRCWCQDREIDPSTLTDHQLGQHACRYLGISITQVKEDLGHTPRGLWKTNASKRL